MNYRISTVQILDYKRISEVTIKPDADAVWVLLGGDNAQGKTSVLDALEALLGGANAVLEDPVRHGAERAEIRGRLESDGDGPPLTVRRKIEANGDTVLEVRDDLGKVKAPQDLLNKIIGDRAIDPLAFLRLSSAEQRAKLLRLIDAGGEIAKLDERYQRLFARRTEVGRDLKRTTGAAASMPEVEVGTLIDVSRITQEMRQISSDIEDGRQAIHRHELAQSRLDAARRRVTAAQRELDLATQELRTSDAVSDELRGQLPPKEARLDAERKLEDKRGAIATASDHNQRVANARAAADRRSHVLAERDRHQVEHDALERQMADIAAAKDARLRAADLPVVGLGVSETGVTYQGAPLASASGAERMCVAIALAAAARPQLRDVWVRDAAVLDAKTMERVAAFARENKLVMWLERVETRDPGVIEIRDGRVAEAAQKELFG